MHSNKILFMQVGVNASRSFVKSCSEESLCAALGSCRQNVVATINMFVLSLSLSLISLS